jgi:hypothetical protein
LEGLRGIEEGNVKEIGPRNYGKRITTGISFAWGKRLCGSSKWREGD